MRKTVTVCVLSALLGACATAGGDSGAPSAAAREPAAAPAPTGADVEKAAQPQPAQGGEKALEEFLAKADARAEKVRTLEAAITFTKIEEFSGHKSVRSGKVYVRKPHDIHIHFTRDYERKIWITETEIVDYKIDSNTADKLIFGEAQDRPEIFGLTTRFGELRERLEMTLEAPSEPHPGRYVLTLKPRPEFKADFTSAEAEIDAGTLFPVKITQKDSELDETKVYEFSEVRENPRLSRRLFEPALKKDTDVEVVGEDGWKGP